MAAHREILAGLVGQHLPQVEEYRLSLVQLLNRRAGVDPGGAPTGEQHLGAVVSAHRVRRYVRGSNRSVGVVGGSDVDLRGAQRSEADFPLHTGLTWSPDLSEQTEAASAVSPPTRGCLRLPRRQRETSERRCLTKR